MRDDWVFIDYVRNFMPDWLSELMSLKVFGAITLALVILVVILKVEGSIA